MAGGQSSRRAKLPRMPLRQLNVRVPEDELELVRKAAAGKGISVGEYVRRAIALQLAYERWFADQTSDHPAQGPPPDR